MPQQEDETEIEARQLIDSLGSRYEQVERIAAGGMGVVFRAEDTILLRTVAIKVLLATKAGSEQILRFQQEAKACSRLKHTNLIGVLDFGVGPSGHPYLIMDYADGQSLDRTIAKQGPLPIEVAVPIFKSICQGMEHAHQSGVIHRDLKPSNIVLLKDKSGSDAVRVLDFGIARITEKDNRGRSLTTEGAALGTPAYMPPEQISGKGVDQRSDIYSMGCVMFKTLTGRVPFRSNDPLVVLTQHLQAPPPMLRATCQREFPEELERIVEKCLRKDPAERYQSMAELYQDLESLLQPAPQNLEVQESELNVQKPRLRLTIMHVVVSILGLCAAVAGYSKYQNSVQNTYSRKDTQAKHERIKHQVKDNSFNFQRTTKLPFNLMKEGDKHLVWRSDDFNVKDEDLLLLSKQEPHDLDFRGCGLNGSGFRYLANWPVRYINASGTSLDDNGLALIAKLPQLARLSLCQNSITDAGIKSLAGIKDLEYLDIADCPRISNDGIRSLIKNCKKLQDLDVSGTGVTGDLFPAFANAAELKRLVLSSLKLQDRDVLRFGCPKKLEYLYLSKNPDITDATLKRLQTNKSLTYLNIGDCPGITDSGIAKFLKARPGCKVNRKSAKSESIRMVDDIGIELMSEP